MKVKDNGNGTYSFYCPGCGHDHVFYVGIQYHNGSRWSFNGDLNNPTFSPSLLNRWGVEADPKWNPEFEDGTDHTKMPYSGRCHLHVENGVINYCGDCTHEYSGKR